MTVIPFKKLDKKISKALLEWLAPLGFKQTSDGGCERREGDIYTYIGCVVNRIGGLNFIVPFGQMGFIHSQKIYSEFMTGDPDELKIAVDIQQGYEHFMRDWNARIPCQHEEEVETTLEQIKAFIFEQLYPTLTAYPTPRQVLDLYIKYDETKGDFGLPGFQGYDSALGALILARLHAPEHYEKLKKRYKPILDEVAYPPDRISEGITNLINYLDQKELTPL